MKIKDVELVNDEDGVSLYIKENHILHIENARVRQTAKATLEQLIADVYTEAYADGVKASRKRIQLALGL